MKYFIMELYQVNVLCCVCVQDPSTSEQLLTPLVAVMTVLADQNAPSKYMRMLDAFLYVAQ